MACGNFRRQPKTLPPTKSFPLLGEQGFMMIEYVGTEKPETWYGEVTNTPYPFDDNSVRYVDIRDAAFFLGPDFVEVK